MPANTAAPAARSPAVVEEQRRGVDHLGEAGVAHLEHADLVGGAEAVLGRRAGCGTDSRARPRSSDTASTMCSTTRGPAIWPSLVTWPTRITATPRFLARRTSSEAQARTWVTEPGPASCASLHMVWMESITTRSKCSRLQAVDDVAQAPSRRPASPGRRPGPSAGRAAADLFDGFLAGDVGARARRAAPRWAATCSSSVDLPTPGSPPIRMARARAPRRRRRPGRTRRRRWRCAAARAWSRSQSLEGQTADLARGLGRLQRARRRALACSSTRLFQAPHAGTLARPASSAAAPQDWQT